VISSSSTSATSAWSSSDDGGSEIQTIEYNTNAGGSREGDGCWEKDRRRGVQKLIRIL